jgi:hypothetical protein
MEKSYKALKMIEVLDLQLVHLERNRQVDATGLVQNQKVISRIKDAVQWRNKFVQTYEDAQTALQYLNDMNLWYVECKFDYIGTHYYHPISPCDRCQFGFNLQKCVVINMGLPCIRSYDICCQYAFNLQERATPHLTLVPRVLANDAQDDDDVPDLEEVEPSDGEQA